MKYLILLCTLLPFSLWAAEPTLLVDSRLTPKQQVLVGGTVTLEVDLLVDTWFTSAPQLPKLELPGAVVSEPSSQATHLTQQRDGKTFFGLRFTYRITPQQEQAFTIPALSIQVQPGQGSKPQTVQTQPQSFSATRPAGADDQEHVLVAEQVTYSQNIIRSHEPLRVGDSITRQLSVRAKGAQAMLIPAPELAEIEGLKRYVQTPQVQPMDDGRGDITGGMRNDTITYVVSKQGDYRLPAIELKWWDQTGQPQIATIPEIKFEAQGESGYSAPFSIAEDLRQLGQNTRLHIARHWLLLSALLVLAALLAYFGRTYWHRGWQFFLKRRAARQQALHDSADFAWQQLQARLNDQTLPVSELYRWIKRSVDADTLQSAAKSLPSHLGNQLLIFLKASYSKDKIALARATEQKQLLTKVRQQFNDSRTAPPAAGALKPLNPKH